MKTNIWTVAVVSLVGACMSTSALAADAKVAAKAPAKAAAKSTGKSTAGFPRVAGHPDFSGVWSAMDRPNWNIEPHLASSALQLQQGPLGPLPAKEVLHLGAVGAVPEGLGIV